VVEGAPLRTAIRLPQRVGAFLDPASQLWIHGVSAIALRAGAGTLERGVPRERYRCVRTGGKQGSSHPSSARRGRQRKRTSLRAVDTEKVAPEGGGSAWRLRS
jgi:hypothetical protein